MRSCNVCGEVNCRFCESDETLRTTEQVKRLSRMRARADLSYDEFAKRAGWTRGFVERIEHSTDDLLTKEIIAMYERVCEDAD